jgi:hypothetical protein
MVNDKYILDSQSERRDRGESENINIACELTAQTDVKGYSENTPVVSNTIKNNSSAQQTNNSIPFTIYHQNIRGLRGKVNELLSQLISTPPSSSAFF